MAGMFLFEGLKDRLLMPKTSKKETQSSRGETVGRKRTKQERTKQTKRAAPHSDLILGAHMSIAGGFYRALERGRAEGCDCVQLFTVSPRAWPVPEVNVAKTKRNQADQSIEESAVDSFQLAVASNAIQATLVHASYLLNLASPDEALWKRSIDGLVWEMRRAAQLGIPAVVVHPGAYTTSSEEAGLRRIGAALHEVDQQLTDQAVVCLLENTAGQGTQLGYRLEHLAQLLEDLANPRRFGVCLDTCHFFAAGYALDTPQNYAKTFSQLDRLIGCDLVQAIHLNDSKQPFGSRKDRHEHIGEGQMGLDPFRMLLSDDRFRQVPMYLETPKGDHGKKSWDVVNLERLRSLSK